MDSVRHPSTVPCRTPRDGRAADRVMKAGSAGVECGATQQLVGGRGECERVPAQQHRSHGDDGASRSPQENLALPGEGGESMARVQGGATHARPRHRKGPGATSGPIYHASLLCCGVAAVAARCPFLSLFPRV
eukprot:scaffold11383_cov123-Isochrysis_galbana.AAC.10